MSGLYLYAVTESRPARLGSGIGGARLRALDEGALVVVAHEVGTIPPLTRRCVLQHDAVVRRLARQVEAILPCRFGSVASDEESLARSLSSRRRALRTALDRVRGREQMTVRVYGDVERAPRRSRESPGAGPGTAYLAAARRARVRRVALVRPLSAALGPLVEAEIVEEHDAPPLVATLHHLIVRGRARVYTTQVRRASRAHRIRATITGPAPPYAFATEWLR